MGFAGRYTTRLERSSKLEAIQGTLETSMECNRRSLPAERAFCAAWSRACNAALRSVVLATGITRALFFMVDCGVRRESIADAKDLDVLY